MQHDHKRLASSRSEALAFPTVAESDAVASHIPPISSVAPPVETPTDILRRRIDVSDLRNPRWVVPLSRACGVHLAVGGTIAATAAVTQDSMVGGVAIGAVAAALLSFAYRGLENLVHGASHHDIFGRKGEVMRRSRAAMNDCLGNMIIAIPVAQDVAAFRAGHLADHHGGFDRARDPCRKRMLRHKDVQANKLPSLAVTLRQVPAETIAFYRTVGASPWMPLRCLLWHAAVYVAPLAMIFGFVDALLAWALVMMPLFLVTLPIVRCLAETGEHDYRTTVADLSMVERTFGHDGVANRLIHLFGDELHPEHHLWPDVPQYHLRTARRRAEAQGLQGLFKRRNSILGPVVTDRAN